MPWTTLAHSFPFPLINPLDPVKPKNSRRRTIIDPVATVLPEPCEDVQELCHHCLC